MEEINLNWADKPNITVNGNELIIRQGEAPDNPERPSRQNHIGNIKAPADFYEGKRRNDYPFDLSLCILRVNRDGSWIEFKTDDQFDESAGYVVEGQLVLSSEIKELNINNEQTLSAKVLAKQLKFRRSYFVDKDENARVIAALTKFKARVTQDLEKEDDLSGNKKFLYEQKLESEFNESFQLCIPIWKGEEKQTFTVDIRFDVADGTVVFWLESVYLKELQDKQRDEIIDREIKRFGDLTVIEI